MDNNHHEQKSWQRESIAYKNHREEPSPSKLRNHHREYERPFRTPLMLIGKCRSIGKGERRNNSGRVRRRSNGDNQDQHFQNQSMQLILWSYRKIFWSWIINYRQGLKEWRLKNAIMRKKKTNIDEINLWKFNLIYNYMLDQDDAP